MIKRGRDAFDWLSMLLTALTSLGDKRASHLPQQLHNLHCTHSEPVWCSHWVASVEIRYHHSTFPDILQERLIQAAYFSDRALHQSHSNRNVWFWLSLWQPDLWPKLFLSNLKRNKKCYWAILELFPTQILCKMSALMCRLLVHAWGANSGLPKYWVSLSTSPAYQRSTHFRVGFLSIHEEKLLSERIQKYEYSKCQENVNNYVC